MKIGRVKCKSLRCSFSSYNGLSCFFSSSCFKCDFSKLFANFLSWDISSLSKRSSGFIEEVSISSNRFWRNAYSVWLIFRLFSNTSASLQCSLWWCCLACSFASYFYTQSRASCNYYLRLFSSCRWLSDSVCFWSTPLRNTFTAITLPMCSRCSS